MNVSVQLFGSHHIIKYERRKVIVKDLQSWMEWLIIRLILLLSSLLCWSIQLNTVEKYDVIKYMIWVEES